MSQTPVLEIERVSCGYSEEPAVEDVSLAVQAGEFVGLIGPNGGGKSTLLRAAVGLLRPWSGSVRLFGQPLERFSGWHRLGYVPQVSAARLDFPATVREVVLMGRTARRGLLRPFDRQDHRDVDQALGWVGMQTLRDRRIGELSTGQRQRVMVARALAGEPELLLLDEPAAGVDAVAKAEMLDLLNRRCREAHLAILYISHDIEALRPCLDKVAVLNRQLVFFGPIAAPGAGDDMERHLVAAALAADHRAY